MHMMRVEIRIIVLMNIFFIDLCLPAVFMPFRSGNVINPRAYQFFHPVGK
jgi:hypothetical protein